MKTYNINIATPCKEDWAKMTQTEKGKHCALCNKVVIDFSKLNDAQIIHILEENKGKKICGNFYQSQIKRPIYISIEKKQYKWPAIAAMLVAGMFQLAPIHTFAQKETKTTLSTNAIIVERSGENKKPINTEPSKDSLVTYSIKILDKGNKNIIIGATVTIETIGTYTTDKNGLISFSIEEKNIPSNINIEFIARGYKYEKITILKSKIIKEKNIEFWLTEKEEIMLRGDVSY